MLGELWNCHLICMFQLLSLLLLSLILFVSSHEFALIHGEKMLCIGLLGCLNSLGISISRNQHLIQILGYPHWTQLSLLGLIFELLAIFSRFWCYLNEIIQYLIHPRIKWILFDYRHKFNVKLSELQLLVCKDFRGHFAFLLNS